MQGTMPLKTIILWAFFSGAHGPERLHGGFLHGEEMQNIDDNMIVASLHIVVAVITDSKRFSSAIHCRCNNSDVISLSCHDLARTHENLASMTKPFASQ